MYVGGQVLGQVVGPGEALAAHLAVVGPLPGVDSQVPGEVALAAEGTTAEQANEGSLTGVLAHVELQVFLGADALAAEGTREASLASVGGRLRSLWGLAASAGVPVVDAQVEAGRRRGGGVGLGSGFLFLGVASHRGGGQKVTGAAQSNGQIGCTAGVLEEELARLVGVVLDARGLGARGFLAGSLGRGVATSWLIALRFGVDSEWAGVAGATGLQLGRLTRARHLVAALGQGLGFVGRCALETLQRVV